MRWCDGPCGRELPLEAFDLKQGYRTRACHQCRAMARRTRFRTLKGKKLKRRQNVRDYWRAPERRRARARDWYWSNLERARRKARAYYLRNQDRIKARVKAYKERRKAAA